MPDKTSTTPRVIFDARPYQHALVQVCGESFQGNHVFGRGNAVYFAEGYRFCAQEIAWDVYSLALYRGDKCVKQRDVIHGMGEFIQVCQEYVKMCADVEMMICSLLAGYDL